MLTYALYARSLCLFRRLRKHEKFLVRHALHGFKLSHCAWLTAHKFAGPKEDKLEREAGSEGEGREHQSDREGARVGAEGCQALRAGRQAHQRAAAEGGGDSRS